MSHKKRQNDTQSGNGTRNVKQLAMEQSNTWTLRIYVYMVYLHVFWFLANKTHKLSLNCGARQRTWAHKTISPAIRQFVVMLYLWKVIKMITQLYAFEICALKTSPIKTEKTELRFSCLNFNYTRRNAGDNVIQNNGQLFGFRLKIQKVFLVFFFFFVLLGKRAFNIYEWFITI